MNDILIYTQHQCKQSDKLRHFLNLKKVQFIEKDISYDVLTKREMIERTGGKVLTPQVFINSNHIGGLDELVKSEFMANKAA